MTADQYKFQMATQGFQSARVLQKKRFSNNRSSDIICRADMFAGEIRRFCTLQDEGVALSFVEASGIEANNDDTVKLLIPVSHQLVMK